MVKNIKPKKYFVDYNGKIEPLVSPTREVNSENIKSINKYIILSPNIYNKIITYLISLFISIEILLIIKKYTYHIITINNDNIYSRVIAQCYYNHNIKFTLCKSNNRNIYYNVDNNLEIPFHNANFNNNFTNNNFHNSIKIIPNSKSDIKRLESHTNLSNLEQIQNYILNKYNSQINISNIAYNKSADNNQIISVKKFFGGLYYITTNTNIWISKYVLNDDPLPLTCSDIVMAITSTINPNIEPVINPNIEPVINPNIDNLLITQNSCTIFEKNNIITLDNSSHYIVNNDLSINYINDLSQKLSKDLSKTYESQIYHLKNPRNFMNNGNYMIHPFHVPFTWDTYLSLMIIGLGIIIEK
jgi:hypothetical protein